MTGDNLKALLERVRRATEQRGKKTELANFLRVNPVQVSHWLSGFRSPNGEVTLQMLIWVQAQEGKQKESGPRSARNTARTKTRSTSLSHERKTGPRKP